MDKNILWGILIIGWSIIIGILILTKVVSSNIGAGLSMMGIFILIGFRVIPGVNKLLKKKSGKDNSDSTNPAN